MLLNIVGNPRPLKFIKYPPREGVWVSLTPFYPSSGEQQYSVLLLYLLLIDFQPHMSMETPVNQPNGQPQMTDESKEPTSPVVGFSDPNVTLVPPAGVTLHDQSSVIT